MRTIFAAVLTAMMAALPAAAQVPRTILFVGNSFTQGAHSAVRNWHADTVTDLNGDGYGGVPALFRAFTQQAGLNYAVSLETDGGRDLAWHIANRRAVVDRRWDVVVLQDYSTISREHPGDPATQVRDAPILAAMFTRANPAVDVELMATWTRADQTYLPGGHWFGKPVTAMADDLRAAADLARRASRDIDGVLPVGQAFSRAIAAGLADPDPYDGTAAGQVDLWTFDHYHASMFGYYLEALVVFGRVTGRDPRSLGQGERAADELGIAPQTAAALQRIAYEQLRAG